MIDCFDQSTSEQGLVYLPLDSDSAPLSQLLLHQPNAQSEWEIDKEINEDSQLFPFRVLIPPQVTYNSARLRTPPINQRRDIHYSTKEGFLLR